MSRKEVGANGLYLPSTLKKSDVGKLGRDDNGTIKILKKSGSKLAWKNLTRPDVKAVLNPIPHNKKKTYNNKLEKNLRDEVAIRNILVSVLKDMQPKKSEFIK